MTSEAELQGISSSSPENCQAPESSNREASHLQHCQAVIEDQTNSKGSNHSSKHLANANKNILHSGLGSETVVTTSTPIKAHSNEERPTRLIF